ncbi:MAG: heavy metal translocating P-type ATPase metal-binding domain-containing protein [Verrucomicrobiales bacterium]
MSTATATLCRHCGTPCPDERSEFCCGGCQFVYRLIHESGFDQYYDLKGARELAPAGSAPPFANTVDPWLAETAGKAEAAAGESGSADLEVGLSGLSCAACVWLIERLFERSPGALRIEIGFASGAARGSGGSRANSRCRASPPRSGASATGRANRAWRARRACARRCRW